MSRQDLSPSRIRFIAGGATAELHESRDEHGNPVALKRARDRKFNAVIRHEAQIAKFLRHPALMPVLASGTDREGRDWVMLPLLSGKTLEDRTGSDAELLDALAPVADALDWMHHKGFGHADLKPANILAAAETGAEAYLLGDLGLVTALGELARGGTPAYLSASRLDEREFTWRDDLHSFAVLLYEAMAGAFPFPHSKGEALLKSIRAGEARPPSTFRSDLPGEVDALFFDAFSVASKFESLVGWMSELRALFGRPEIPHSLFLRQPAADSSHEEDAEAAKASSGDRLREVLGRRLYSVMHERVPPADDALSVLKDLGRDHWPRLVCALEFLVEEHILRDHLGWARFEGPVSAWRDRLLSHLDSRAPIPRASGAVEGLPAREGDADLSSAWDEAGENHEEKLRLLESALSQGRDTWIASLPDRSFLLLADHCARESRERILALLGEADLEARAHGKLSVFSSLHALREGESSRAVANFRRADEAIGVEVAEEMLKRIFYAMINSGEIEPGLELIRSWWKKHAAAIAGSRLEINLAAREISALAKFGDLSLADELAADYEKRFAGRPGAWVLHMAIANIASEQSDRLKMVTHAQLALAGNREEEGDPALEIHLLNYLAANLMLLGNAEGLARVPRLLDEATGKVRELGNPSLLQQVMSTRALWELHRGHADRAEDLCKTALQSARESGHLAERINLRHNLALSLFHQGDYRGLVPQAATLSSPESAPEGLNDLLYSKVLLALFSTAFGDLDGVDRQIREGLPIAREVRARKNEGYLRLREAVLRHCRGDRDGAMSSLEAAEAIFRDIVADDEVWRCRLWSLEFAADTPTGEKELREVISGFESIGKPLHLPFAWKLMARRHRLAGDQIQAYAALQSGFEIAEELGNPESIWPLCVEAAELARAGGDLIAARSQLVRAVEALQDLSLHFPPGTERDRFLARADRRAVLDRLRDLGSA